MKELNELPDHAKVWIYAATKELSDNEVNSLMAELKPEIEGWKAHGQKLDAACEIVSNRFIIIAVDEKAQQATGCSIDHIVRSLKLIESKRRLGIFEKANVFFEREDGIHFIPFTNLKFAVLGKEIQPDSTVYDLNVKNLGEYKSEFKKRADSTWLMKYFQGVNA